MNVEGQANILEAAGLMGLDKTVATVAALPIVAPFFVFQCQFIESAKSTGFK